MENLEEILIYEESGLFDIEFPVETIKKENEKVLLNLKGELKGEVLEFKLEVASNFPAGFKDGLPDEDSLIKNGVKFTFDEDNADIFGYLITLAYGLEDEGPFTSNQLVFTAFPLEDNPKSVDEGVLRLKLFLENESTDEKFVEFYLTLDLQNNVVELNEYHADYRIPFLQILKMDNKKEN